MKLLANIFSLCILFVITTQFCIAQNYADADYYLVKKLEIDKVSKTDKLLLDSCLHIYHKSKEDTIKAAAIKTIVEESWDDNVWPKYNDWLYHFAKKNVTKKLPLKIKRNLMFVLGATINNQGYYYSTKGNPKEALKSYEQSLSIQLKLNDKEGAATSLNNIGAIYNRQGDIPQALKTYHKSLDIYKSIAQKNGIAQTLNNIGHIYKDQKELDLALEYFHRSLKIFKEVDNKRGTSTLYNSIGHIYFLKNNYDKALNYYLQALEIRKESNDQKGVAGTYSNIGVIYENQKDFKKAKEYFNEGLKVYLPLNYKVGLAIVYNNLGRVSMLEGNLKKAKEYSLKSLSISKELGSPTNIKSTAEILSKIYQKEGDGIKALEMYQLYISMRDSLFNEETKLAAATEQARFEYEKLKAIDDAEYDKIIALKNKEKEKQEVISYAIAIGLILVICFLLFVFNRLKITRKQKRVIEHQNNEIVDSITYAKRIQDAILPTDKYFKECLPDSFVIYEPKDIVAGDFYWVHQHEDLILFAAADCTGHGVPGAMVSVVCHNALDMVLREFKLTQPAEILDKTRELVSAQLNKSINQSSDIKNIRDGMDIALCCLNKKTNILDFSGAFNPLWIYKNPSKTIKEIKATRQSIGRVDSPKPFVNHSIALEKDDTIYIFSDGYADQFGGKDGKKLMKKRFKELIINIQEKPMNEQAETILQYFKNWKGNMEQIDDVCVIGIKI